MKLTLTTIVVIALRANTGRRSEEAPPSLQGVGGVGWVGGWVGVGGGGSVQWQFIHKHHLKSPILQLEALSIEASRERRLRERLSLHTVCIAFQLFALMDVPTAAFGPNCVVVHDSRKMSVSISAT
jgi:hypothetical protein